MIQSFSGSEITYADALYFSIVTISSLGYGDLRPIRAGRTVASVEVISGLILLGLGVAKLASARQESYVRRIYGNSKAAALEGFRKRARRHLDEAIDNLSDESNLTAALAGLESEIADLARYLRSDPLIGAVQDGPALTALIAILNTLEPTVHLLSEEAIAVASTGGVRAHAKDIRKAMYTCLDVLESSRGELHRVVRLGCAWIRGYLDEPP
jgi:hypothetical protein